ncbi:rhodanese [Novosphingobium profundi]|nr:rhodanese [Novosphingobium profundi]
MPAEVFDAQGYRCARYRAPVDRDPAPARRLSQAEALRLVPGRDALFIDVLPAQGGWRDPASGIWSLAVAHQTIAGALWHPETGRCAPDRLVWHGLAAAVAEARRADPARPVVVFCRTDCWMGWNAARRLAREGFTAIYWYAEGIEGWRAAGRELVDARPVTVGSDPMSQEK